MLRYLQALEVRLDKLAGDPARDRLSTAQVASVMAASFLCALQRG